MAAPIAVLALGGCCAARAALGRLAGDAKGITILECALIGMLVVVLGIVALAAAGVGMHDLIRTAAAV